MIPITPRQRRGARQPTVNIQPQQRRFVVSLDMTPTGAPLNAVGQQALANIARRAGGIQTADGWSFYSLSTAQRLAKEIGNIARNTRFRSG